MPNKDYYLGLITAVSSKSQKAIANGTAVAVALDMYAHKFGLDMPHRLAQYLSQLSHESAGFEYDQELWGPTAAQARYDTRTDLGNTPEKDGDGHKYRGRTGIQITGRSNYRQFYDWCVINGLNPPNFVENPDLVNTDPWEGLAPIWYWSTRNLNTLADRGDNENITRKINGGLNGYADRLARYTKLGLYMLGYSSTHSGIQSFQTVAKSRGTYTGEVDGVDGPMTRAAIHQELAKTAPPHVVTHAAPVTEAVPVAPAGADKVGLTRVAGGVGILSPLVGFFTDMPPEYKLVLFVVSVVAVIALVWKAELIAARVRAAFTAFGLKL